VRGKYAKRYEQGTNLVLLSPDVVRDFPNDEEVNTALRLVMQLKKIPGGDAGQPGRDPNKNMT
jgi:hypothetical protein